MKTQKTVHPKLPKAAKAEARPVKAFLMHDGDAALARSHVSKAVVTDGFVFGYATPNDVSKMKKLGLIVTSEAVIHGPKTKPPSSLPATAVVSLNGPLLEPQRTALTQMGVELRAALRDTVAGQPTYGNYSYMVTVPSREAWEQLRAADFTTGLRELDPKKDKDPTVY